MLLQLAVPNDTSAASPQEVERLLLEMAAGDREALAQLYRRTRVAVYGLALSYLGNSHEADDITQDTFIRAWEQADRYRPQGTPMAWLLTITRNLALMRLRGRGREQMLEPEQWQSLQGPDHLAQLEARQFLSTALCALSEQERQVVFLHAASGLKHREIARVLDLPLPTVLSKYHRALKKLKDRLEGGSVR